MKIFHELDSVFIQSGFNIMMELDENKKRTYYTGTSAIEDKGNSKYFHYNHRGDTVIITDNEGNILHGLNYEAYGEPTDSSGAPVNPLSMKDFPTLFVGGSGIRYDGKTNLQYMRYRWFSQDQMRFISPDLLMGINRYSYVSGNPVISIDISGLEEIVIHIYFNVNTGEIIESPNNLESENLEYIGYIVKVIPEKYKRKLPEKYSGKFPNIAIFLYQKGLLEHVDDKVLIRKRILNDMKKQGYTKEEIKFWNWRYEFNPYIAWSANYFHCLLSCLITVRFNSLVAMQLGHIKEVKSGLRNLAKKGKFYGEEGYCLKDTYYNWVGTKGGEAIKSGAYKKDCHKWCMEHGIPPFRVTKEFTNKLLPFLSICKRGLYGK